MARNDCVRVLHVGSDKWYSEWESSLKARQPTLLKRAASKWPVSEYANLRKFANDYGDSSCFTRFHISARDKSPYESNCLYRKCTLKDLIDWNNCKPSRISDLDPDEYWFYCDYKRISDMFPENHETFAHLMAWKELGVESVATDLTLWLGSPGACTRLHYDTYADNYIVQVAGRKRWYLFPPSATPFLYATRVPYEESTVFSEVDMRDVDKGSFPLYNKAYGVEIVMEKGDVLFLPKHWWHFVENLDLSLSVNHWQDTVDDVYDRVKEAVVRLLMSSLSETGDLNPKNWLNPTEEVCSHEVNMEYLNQALKEYYRAADCAPPHRGQDSVSTYDMLKFITTDNIVESMVGRLIERIKGSLDSQTL